jgi:predicted Zn-dependent protease with MMP-like domain
MALTQRTRDRFDWELEQVLAGMPPLVHQLIEKIPLHVEDYPSREIMERKGIEDPADLCGLFTGIPLPEDSVTQPWKLPDVVTIYRMGVLASAEDRHGRVTTRRLRKEIRITILHELAHFHGLSEEQLEELGYG